MERISGLKFDYQQVNLFDITPQAFGTFDILVFFGVLYHLPAMMKALSILRSVCSGQMFLETHCSTQLTPGISAARYYRKDTLNGSRLNKKDALLVFSVGGGNMEKNVSPNLVAALQLAKERGSAILGVVGRDGG